jgi:hypothetical protein
MARIFLHRHRQRRRQPLHHLRRARSIPESKSSPAPESSHANAICSSGADEVIIPEYERGLMTGRMIQKYYPIPLAIKVVR